MKWLLSYTHWLVVLWICFSNSVTLGQGTFPDYAYALTPEKQAETYEQGVEAYLSGNRVSLKLIFFI